MTYPKAAPIRVPIISANQSNQSAERGGQNICTISSAPPYNMGSTSESVHRPERTMPARALSHISSAASSRYAAKCPHLSARRTSGRCKTGSRTTDMYKMNSATSKLGQYVRVLHRSINHRHHLSPVQYIYVRLILGRWLRNIEQHPLACWLVDIQWHWAFLWYKP